ncbi:oocyte zinc finger protein XlCOF29-like isoform X2 [Phyllobates terribilis]|uniref:oocyte zinc finger protein XlCOF29-like isoform X2 n=1 Tax=Phyllobates terribilis TaxID=111132 RepID=UPI003CCA8530
MAERILHLTLEILVLLTGEDYTVVKKTSSERCRDPVSEGWGRPLSPITGPPSQSLRDKDINDQKILEPTYKLLTGEFYPVRGQHRRDVPPLPLPQDCKQEDSNVPQDHQGEDLTYINTTETYVRSDEQCKEEIPTYDYPDPRDYLADHPLTSLHGSVLTQRPLGLGHNAICSTVE